MLVALEQAQTCARSTQLALDTYDTDKMQNGYMPVYDALFGPWVNQEITLLELGIHRGGSLLLWHDYFPHGKIAGIDCKLPRQPVAPDRVWMFEGDQMDKAFLSDVARRVAPNGFDIIVDDASHVGRCTHISFWHLFEHHLKPGGLYVIEDWRTGYRADYPDGHAYQPYRRRWHLGWILAAIPKISRRLPFYCHRYGMAGFVHDLVDAEGVGPARIGEGKSKLDGTFLMHGLVFVRKANGAT